MGRKRLHDKEQDATVRTEPLVLSPGDIVDLALRSLVWRVVDGPQKGMVFQVEDDPVTIGTSAQCSIVLTDQTVSRCHAEVSVQPEGLLLKDLDSTNGTFVDDNRIREIFIKPGALIRFAGSKLTCTLVNLKHRILPGNETEFHGMIGGSVAARQLFALLDKVGARDITVILSGETGSGKEGCARAIHEASRRRGGPFVVVDCSSLDRELGGSELFGHEAGAFTGAVKSRAGAFELASGGTLFVDELGELPLDLQAKLLRVLERREIKRLGSNATIPINARIVAATHRDLQAMVKEGRFREDLYFRFAQVIIQIPPLRERREDIELLARHFLHELHQQSGGGPERFDAAALEHLVRCKFSGNVRELRNLVHRGYTMATGESIAAADMGLQTAPESARDSALDPPRRAVDPALGPREKLELAERTAIIEALIANDFNRERAAKALGISSPTLRTRIRRHGIKRSMGIDPKQE